MASEWRARLGDGGWIEFRREDMPPVFVRFRLVQRQWLQPCEIFIAESDDPLSSDTMREIRVGQLASIANEPRLRGLVIHHLTWAEEIRGQTEAWIEEIVPSGTRARAPRRSVDLTLPSPKPGSRGKLPDDFYYRFGVAWQWLIATGATSPAQQIAQANEVPESTVHRWAREARRRGILPPSRRKSAE